MLREDAAAAAAEALATQIALCEQRQKNLESLDKSLDAKILASLPTEKKQRLQDMNTTLAKLQQQKGSPSIDVAWMDGGISEVAADAP